MRWAVRFARVELGSTLQAVAGRENRSAVFGSGQLLLFCFGAVSRAVPAKVCLSWLKTIPSTSYCDVGPIYRINVARVESLATIADRQSTCMCPFTCAVRAALRLISSVEIATRRSATGTLRTLLALQQFSASAAQPSVVRHECPVLVVSTRCRRAQQLGPAVPSPALSSQPKSSESHLARALSRQGWQC